MKIMARQRRTSRMQAEPLFYYKGIVVTVSRLCKRHIRCSSLKPRTVVTIETCFKQTEVMYMYLKLREIQVLVSLYKVILMYDNENPRVSKT